jgi:uncharacterized repeat protein (TIGR04138 family)
MLCKKCGRKEATEVFMWGLHEINLCDSCHEGIQGWFNRLGKLAEQCGTVTRIPSLKEIIQRIVIDDSRFASEAYEFVADAMAEAFCMGFPDEGASELKIPTKQLITAIEKLGSKRFGTRARAIFKSWGVIKWSGFGEIVDRMHKADASFFDALDFRKRDFQRRGSFDGAFPKTDRD